MFPERIGRYEIKSEIGRGGMATVYLAHDPRFKRDVAIKVLPPQFLHDPTFRARFDREAQIVASLEHPAIVPVYDYGEEGGLPYLVMRYMTGGTLSDRLANGPLSPVEAARILSRLAPALDEAHKRGIVHRDLKPSNILFDQYGEPYLTDFGIARIAEGAATLTGSAIVGTPAYMSPEQARGDAGLDGRSDIYALGAILFEMLTGRQPYQATTPMAVMLKHLSEPVPRLLEAKADLPPECEAIIARAMAKEPGQRFATAGEMASTQESLARGLAGRAPAGRAAQPAGRARRQAPSSQAIPGRAAPQEAPPPRPARRIPSGRTPLGVNPWGAPSWLWIAGGLIAIAGLCGLGGLFLASQGLFSARPAATSTQPAAAPSAAPSTPITAESAAPTPTRPARPASFKDDFSDPSSGWGRSPNAGSQSGYDAGGYRLVVDEPNTIYWATAGLDFADVSIEVEAEKIAGADANSFGLICRYRDERNFYLLMVSSDGFFSIGKYLNGKFSLVDEDVGGYHRAIHQGKTTNRLRADCIDATLTLFANDTPLGSVEDEDFASGDIGLAAIAFDIPGTNILFDRFSARQP